MKKLEEKETVLNDEEEHLASKMGPILYFECGPPNSYPCFVGHHPPSEKSTGPLKFQDLSVIQLLFLKSQNNPQISINSTIFIIYLKLKIQTSTLTYKILLSNLLIVDSIPIQIRISLSSI